MSDGDRRSKPDPERTGPDRGYSTSFRGADSWNWPGEEEERGSSNGRRGGSLTDVIADGVAMGYRVIEEQIRQGQRVAEQMSGQFSSPGGRTGWDLQDVSQRMWRSYWELTSMWWDLMTSMGGIQAPRRSPWGWAEAPNGDRPEQRDEPSLSIEVESDRAAWAGLVLRPLRGCRSLVALQLRGPDREPLQADVAFQPLEEGEPIRVRIQVEEDQLGGTYTGRVVDGATGEPKGTLSIQIKA